MQEEITHVQTTISKFASMDANDLTVKENVDALVVASLEIAEQRKELDAQEGAIKTHLKDICSDYTDKGLGVICYSYDYDAKVMLTVSHRAPSIDESKLLAALYEKFGEDPTNKTGRAWHLWCQITDPVEVPRVLNEAKLQSYLKASYLKPDDAIIDEETLKSVTKFPAPVVSSRCTKLSAAEAQAHADGTLNDVFVAK